MKRISGTVSRGVVAGILGAAAMALWFLVIDGARGQPFRTPAFLAASLLGGEEVEMSVGRIALYTLIHFGAFILVGIAVSWLLQKLHVVPSILLGLVLGFLLFDVVFYFSVVVTGENVVQLLGWPEVLAGNLLAGVALMGFLHLVGAARPVTWWETLAEHEVVREGIVTGLIGAVVVAAWFLLFDLVQGEPFFTPGALGSALFLGAGELDAVVVDWVTVAGYTVLHFGAFIVTGLIASAIVTEAESTPPIILGAVLLFVTFEAFIMGLLAIAAQFLLGALAWWTILGGNILAAMAMGWYLWHRHPVLRRILMEDPVDRTM